MKIKTSELIDVALDWAVAKCGGKNGVLHDDGITRCVVIAAPSGVYKGTWRPSLNWAQGGPIVEREHIAVWWDGVWHSKYDGCRPDQVQDALTPLIAAMRCYVASKLGDEIDIPKELT